MNHPTASLSFIHLACTQTLALCAAAILWGAGAIIWGYGSTIALTGAMVMGVLLVISIVVLAIFTPSKQRPVATLATLWSAASFVRFLAALGALSLLYYTAQFGLRPMMFSFLLAAIFLLVAETRMIAHTLSGGSAETGSLTEE